MFVTSFIFVALLFGMNGFVHIRTQCVRITSPRCDMQEAASSFKGFGSPPQLKTERSEEEQAQSRSEQKRRYQELKKKAKASSNVHKLVGGANGDEKQSKQRSQAW